MTQTNSDKRLRNLPGSSKRERGALVIEFALIAPFILFLLGYIMRLTLILQAQQIAMTLSREVATSIFRGCADITILQPQNADGALRVDQAVSAAATVTCLTNARQSFLNRWADIRPIGAPENPEEVTFNVSVYRQSFSTLGASETCPCSQEDCSTTKITQFGNEGSSNDINTDIMCQRNRVVRVQLQFQLNPLFAFLNLIPVPNIPNTIQINEETVI